MNAQFDMLDPLGLSNDLTVNNSMSSFKREYPPKGNRHGVICFIVAAGTHTETFPGKAPKASKKVLCIYELKDRREDGKRFVLNKKWTYSMDERANMRGDINGMGFDTDEDFNLKELAGHNFMVNITHEKDKKGEVSRAKPGDFTALMEGVEPIKPELTELPDWAKVYISESVEYKQKFGPGAVGPYAEAIKKDLEKKAKYGDNKPAQGGEQGNQAPPPAEDDLPF
jgi:hypothetical protein